MVDPEGQDVLRRSAPRHRVEEPVGVDKVVACDAQDDAVTCQQPVRGGDDGHPRRFRDELTRARRQGRIEAAWRQEARERPCHGSDGDTAAGPTSLAYAVADA